MKTSHWRRPGCVTVIAVPLLLVVGLTACDFRNEVNFKVCEFLPTSADAKAAERAWGGLKKDGAMLAFAINRGIITEAEAIKIPVEGWPPGKKEAVEACIEEK